MNWHDLRRPDDPELDALAQRYGLHPLHIEDCRHRDQRAKVEEGAGYLFVVLKPVYMDKSGELQVTDLDFFIGPDFLVTVDEGECPTLRAHLDQIHAGQNQQRADQLFYRIADGVVDGYASVLDSFDERIDSIEEGVIDSPTPETLQSIFAARQGLVTLRRALGNMRDVAGHIQRMENHLIGRDLSPFLRDLYDHLARNLDAVEMQRDLLTGAMDVYLSSITQRTNEVMKVLTVFGTLALPALVISGIFGMNLKGLPWAEHPYGGEFAMLSMALSTGVLLYILRRLGWF